MTCSWLIPFGIHNNVGFVFLKKKPKPSITLFCISPFKSEIETAYLIRLGNSQVEQTYFYKRISFCMINAFHTATVSDTISAKHALTFIQS